jgi:hypothetical protein
MRARISIAVAAVLYGGLAMANGQKLGDTSLDTITAGTATQVQSPVIASGGAVVGNNSEADIKTTGTLNLSGEAQSGATGLNIVNGSESTVANGVNVWDGQVKDAAGTAAARLEVNQSNVVEQEQRRVAFLPEYERSEANRSRTWTEDSTYDSKGSQNRSNEIFDTHSTSSSRALTSEGSVNTETAIAGQTIRGGRGIAGAGDLHVDFDGGDIALGITGNIADVLEGTITLEIGLPELSIDFNGGGCAVQMGSCEGKGSLTESSSEESDNSRIETLAQTTEEHKTFEGGGTEDVRSPFEVRGAQAEYIVVDDSTIRVDSNYGVTLGGNTQKDLRALNAVNAAGSAVANAVNISRTPSAAAGQTLALNQQNLIRHSR